MCILPYHPTNDPKPRRSPRTPIEQRPQTPSNKALADYITHLRWCDALVLVYPTWWYGQPAILKVCTIHARALFIFIEPVRGPRLPTHHNHQQTKQSNTQGWIDRTFLPHAAFTLPGPGSPPPSVVGLVPQLQNIKYVECVHALFLALPWFSPDPTDHVNTQTRHAHPNNRKVGVVTTYGSEWKVIRYVGDPGRRIISRGVCLVCVCVSVSVYRVTST